jgi:thioredoxin reductase
MTRNNEFDVVIIGGSYSGLAAAMALGRSLKNVLVVDDGKPCNRQTPHSHNFLTQDGSTPKEISTLARQQVEKYKTVKFLSGLLTSAVKTGSGFESRTNSDESFTAKKLIFATGIKDILPPIEGVAECWGISALHCPYCHGYEVRNEKTGIMANGDDGFEFASLISNWTKDLTLFTNGRSALTPGQTANLERHHVKIVQTEIEKLVHSNGHIEKIVSKDGTAFSVKAVYVRTRFEQNSSVPVDLGCELTEEGFIKTDGFQKTTVAGVFACGDMTTRMRTVANAVATGTTAGMMANREIVFEGFA